MQNKLDIVAILFSEGNGATIIFSNDLTVKITEDAAEMLRDSFPGECEACGFDPERPMDYDDFSDEFGEDI